MICVGGYTRLTRSGLSMVDWRPQGRALPSTTEEWEAEFDKYKAFPEYQMVNRHISLDEFKDIYFVEWFHRMWGRALGALFLLPAAYFAARGMIPPHVTKKVVLAGALGATQGAVGWWMVRSGLEQKTADDFGVPRVSVAASAAKSAVRAVKPLAVGAAALAGITAASGAFVAGNDAGRAYNDWPLMAGRWIPEELWKPELGLKNVFENTATVQFDHRMLAYSTLATAGAMVVAARRPGVWSALPGRVKHGVMALAGAVSGQALLGISTLMLYVPVWLGTAHQGGAVIVWTAALSLLHSLRSGAAGKVAAAAAASPGVRAALAAPLCGVGAAAAGMITKRARSVEEGVEQSEAAP
ncbi:COX15 [Symbiodinium sp. KB8]|nr:COX15 [Symbiodinium sp. KB8]